MTLVAYAVDIDVEDYEKYGIGKYATYASFDHEKDSSSRNCPADDVLLGDLVHYNRVSSAISMRTHCDFHSVDLGEFKDAILAIISAKSIWEEALGHEVVESEVPGLAYTDENANHPPRRRRFLDVNVRVVPGAKRKRRVYTDEDHQVWRS